MWKKETRRTFLCVCSCNTDFYHTNESGWGEMANFIFSPFFARTRNGRVVLMVLLRRLLSSLLHWVVASFELFSRSLEKLFLSLSMSFLSAENSLATNTTLTLLSKKEIFSSGYTLLLVYIKRETLRHMKKKFRLPALCVYHACDDILFLNAFLSL